MKITLNKIFPMNSGLDVAWQCLQDIETVAGCMPGAEITEKTDEENFKGKVKVKLGPVVMAFNGDIKVENIDSSEHKIHLIASGKDNKGTSSANMDLTAFVRSGESNGCELVGDADVTVNGKLANFGGRMMTQVTDQILSQFADNFSKKLDSITTGGDSAAPNSEQSLFANDQLNEINGFSIVWSVMIGFFKRFLVKTTRN